MAEGLRLPLPRAPPTAAHHLQRTRLRLHHHTQPLTLLADPWGCALFLDQGGDLWHVPAMTNGTWDWDNAAEIDSHADHYHTSRTIEHLLRQAAARAAHDLFVLHALGGSPVPAALPRADQPFLAFTGSQSS